MNAEIATCANAQVDINPQVAGSPLEASRDLATNANASVATRPSYRQLAADAGVHSTTVMRRMRAAGLDYCDMPVVGIDNKRRPGTMRPEVIAERDATIVALRAATGHAGLYLYQVPAHGPPAVAPGELTARRVHNPR